jgi:hypothetical protein
MQTEPSVQFYHILFAEEMWNGKKIFVNQLCVKGLTGFSIFFFRAKD